MSIYFFPPSRFFYSVLTTTQNYLGIELFGELEFWLSSFKVVIIVGIIIFALVIACGGGPNGDAPGFRYWHNPGAFAELYSDGSLGKFLGFWSVMVNATFAYLGTELVGVTAGEAQNPRRSIPKGMFILFLYTSHTSILRRLTGFRSHQAYLLPYPHLLLPQHLPCRHDCPL